MLGTWFIVFIASTIIIVSPFLIFFPISTNFLAPGSGAKYAVPIIGLLIDLVSSIDSTTGEVTIGNPDIPGADFTVNTSITLAGGCGTHKSEMITGNVTPDAGNFNSYSYHIRGISDADIDKVELGDNIRIKPDSITGTDILETDRDNYIIVAI